MPPVGVYSPYTQLTTMNSPIVYLAGGIAYNSFDEATQWRKQATEYLGQHGILTRDPMRGKHQEKWQDGDANHDHPGFDTHDIFTRDTKDIIDSDALLVNLSTVKSVGTPFEMGFAYALRKPLFVVTTAELKTHPFVCVPSTIMGTEMDSVLRQLVHFLLGI